MKQLKTALKDKIMTDFIWHKVTKSLPKEREPVLLLQWNNKYHVINICVSYLRIDSTGPYFVTLGAGGKLGDLHK